MLARLFYLPSAAISILRQYLERSRQGTFFANVAILTTGTALGQGITLLATPILTRLYLPDDFGIMAAYASVLSLLSVMVALKYDFAIPLPKDDDEAVNLVVVSIISMLGVTLLTIAGILFLGSTLGPWLQAPNLVGYLWLLPIGLIAVGFYQVLNFWAVRKEQFTVLAKTRVTQMVGRVVVQTIAGFLNFGAGGLIVGYVVGLSGGVGTLSRLLWQDSRELIRKVNRAGIISAATRYRRFPLISSWSSLINSLSQELPVLLISSYFGSDVVGWFYLSLRVLRIPFNLIGQSIAQVFYSRASLASHEGTLSTVTYQIYEQLTKVSFGPLLWLALVAPELFSLVFGSNWELSGDYSRWLAPSIFLLFLTTPLSAIVFVREKQRAELIFQVVLLIARWAVLYMAANSGNASNAILGYSLVSSIILLVYLMWLMVVSGNSMKDATGVLLTELLISIVIVIPILLAMYFKVNTYVLLIVSIICLGVMGVRIFTQLIKIRRPGLDDPVGQS
jgi:O-antigen/teichoic acid export membrane protein